MEELEERVDAEEDERVYRNDLLSQKVGVAQDYTGERIITLNSTKMPIRVELDSAWTFEHDTIDAYQA